ncbi:SRPBCC domain-containing protein [Marivirga salinae]|uniref:SRPBCC domain-containing protein n=1 Tax=Marivirga salinarum TaxID=3059078 RepID=A0AA49GB42_9BACT|nr:SRPBCC domain-containing protein [Marivirga sp. BDSF4-3]WKK78109.2 SRPBCC domain-containing protein [Marivirga sp. BDSF4-3]
MEIKTEITIKASKERIWNILTDLEKYKNWNPFILNSEGEIKEGSRIANTMKNGQDIMKFKPVIIKVEENNYFEWLGSLWFKGVFDGRHYFKIESIGENQITLFHGEHFSGILSKMILKKIGKQTEENFVKMNLALKELAENKVLEFNEK